MPPLSRSELATSSNLLLLVFDVLPQDRKRCTTNRGDEIAVGPERREPTPEPREFAAQQARTGALHRLHEAMNTVLRMNLDERVHMVRHHFEFYQVGLTLRRDIAKDRLEPFVHAANENLAPVFRTPHDVLLARVDDVPADLDL